MRHVRRFSVPMRWRAGVLSLCAAFGLGCHGEVGSAGTTTETTPLCDASDPTQVVAPQRIALLTSTQLMNMVRLVSSTEADNIVKNAVFPVITDLTVRFPPPRAEQFRSIPDSTTLAYFDTMAQNVRDYVRDNFATVTGGKCTPSADACAMDYLNALAAKAYRRPLTTDEQTRFTDLYNNLRSQLVNNYQVTLSVEEATGNAVYALLMSPQLLWRWELGGTETSTSPPGVYLTDAELASSLSFFLTDRPPDDMLLADVQAGTLRANIGAHVSRILGTQASRAWLTHVMRHVFLPEHSARHRAHRPGPVSARWAMP